MKVIIDAKEGRVGFIGQDQKTDWLIVDRESERFLDVLRNGLDKRGLSVDQIDHIFVMQEGATFSNARSAVLLANSLFFTNHLQLSTISHKDLNNHQDISKTAEIHQKSQSEYLNVAYSAAPSITSPKK